MKKRGADKNKSRGDSIGNIRVDVKLNILHTIADTIYATTAGKIREAVANSQDNGASSVIITLDQTNRRLSILDNGTGITKAKFAEIFTSIGYGLLRRDDVHRLSYFGLGLMSVFGLGKQVRLFTRPRNTNEVLCLEVNAGAIFDTSNSDKSIGTLETFISPVKTVTEAERRKSSIKLLNQALLENTPISKPTSYTEIIIEDISEECVEEMGNHDFRRELTQLLPLRPEDQNKNGAPFLDRFTGKKRNLVVELLTNKTYCKTIDVFFAVQEETEDPTAISQLWKYFPRFNSNIVFPDDNVYVGKSADGKFAYYVVHSIGENLRRDEGETDDGKETGFWIRNQNFLVKSADFLDKPGPGRKPAGAIDTPLRNWVFGEIFHQNMNTFLSVSRNEFLYDSTGFGDFRDSFLKTVSCEVNKAIRTVWDKRKPIMDDLLTPFATIADGNGPIIKAQNRLRAIIGPDMADRKFFEIAKDRLSKRRSGVIEDEAARVDTLLSKNKGAMVVMENDDAVVRVVPSLGGGGSHEINWDASAQKIVVQVSPAFFAPRPVLFLGETYDVRFVLKKNTEVGVSIDTTNNRIYINPFNGDLSHFSISILDVYIALDVADAISDTKSALKQNFLKLLGATPCATEKYIVPLGDDLRRSVAYKS